MPRRILLTDVFYQPTVARAAGLLINDWTATLPLIELIHESDELEEYVSGEFYRRELPHLLKLVGLAEDVDCVVVDAHVWLQEGLPGVGYFLWRALDEKIPVLGVAKSPYREGSAQPLIRGQSKKPLWISSAGISTDQASSWISQMAGPYRIPQLLKRVDMLSRGDHHG